jgi:putative redox protein
MSETVVHYEGALGCRAEHAESGTIVFTDFPKDYRGCGKGFSPSEMLSVSLGSCILSIMGIAAEVLQIDMTGATATVAKEMAYAPRRISKISVSVQITGEINEKYRSKLEAAARACPVHHVLGIEVPITFHWN